MNQFDFTPVSVTDGVTRCVNLRCSQSGDSLEVTAAPSQFITGAWVPLLALDDGSQRVLVARGKDVAICDGTEVTQIGQAGAQVMCAVADSATLVTVMTADGPEYLACESDSFTWLGSLPAFPPVRFEAVRRGALTVAVRAHTFDAIDLSGDVASMSDSDVEAYSALLHEVYSSLCRLATSSRQWVQPVMVRASYIDGSGRVLYSCPPLIVGPATGWQGVGTMTVPLTRRSDTDVTASPWTLSLDTFDINLTCDLSSLPTVWRRRVAGVRLCISPQIHPVSTDAATPMAWRIDSHRTNNPVLTLTLPGATASFASLDDDRLADVAVMTARMFTTDRSEDYFDTFPEGTFRIGPRRGVTPAVENGRLIAGMRKALSASIPDTTVAELTAPHSFSARCGTNIGTWQVWGSLVPHLFRGYKAADFAVGEFDTPISIGTRVILTDSEGGSHSLVTSSQSGSLLSPMMCYPHSGARSIALTAVDDTGEAVGTLLRLRRVPGTTWCVALRPNLASLKVSAMSTDDVQVVLPSGGVLAERRDTIVVTSRASRTTPVSVTSCSGSTVTAIFPGRRSSGGLDSSRMRLCLTTTGGIFVCGISARGILDSPMMIDPRPVISSSRAVYTPTGVYAAAGSDLVCIRGNSASTLLHGFTPVALGWNPDFDELWFTDFAGNLSIISPRNNAISSLTLPFQPEALTTVGGRLWLTSDNLLTSAPPYAAEAADDSLVEWIGRVRYTGTSLPCRLILDMSAEWFTGVITMSIDRGGSPQPLITLSVDGPLRAPLSEPLNCPSPLVPYSPPTVAGRAASRHRAVTATDHPWFTLHLSGTATQLRLRSLRFE